MTVSKQKVYRKECHTSYKEIDTVKDLNHSGIKYLDAMSWYPVSDY